MLSLFGVSALIAVEALVIGSADDSGSVAVIFPPGIAQAQAIDAATQAGARLVSAGRFGFIAVVIPDAPGYAGRARAAGAWFSVSSRLVVGCLRGDMA